MSNDYLDKLPLVARVRLAWFFDSWIFRPFVFDNRVPDDADDTPHEYPVEDSNV